MAFSFILLVALLGAASAQQICEPFGSTTTGQYIVMNNRWGTNQEQCIEVTGNGFRITRQDGQAATNGAPVSYPAIYYGCHYNNCSPGTIFPRRISELNSCTSTIQYSYVSGTYDAAYDIWVDPTPKRDGVNQQEIMIWLNRQGSIQPIGSQTGTANIAGQNWNVWTGSNGQNQVISYVVPNPPLGGLSNFNVKDFLNDGISRGLFTNDWYITSIQAGFEPWVGGVGLAVTQFAVNAS